MRKWVGAIAKVRFKSEFLLRCHSLQPRVICYSIHFRSFCSLIYVLALRFFFRNAWSIVETSIYESFVENVCLLCRRLKNRWLSLLHPYSHHQSKIAKSFKALNPSNGTNQLHMPRSHNSLSRYNNSSKPRRKNTNVRWRWGELFVQQSTFFHRFRQTRLWIFFL